MRDSAMSICKGLAIILMVVGHAEAPELVTNFIYTFHMPVFFIAAGYFFSRRHAADPWGFIGKRFKGLYVPFLKWSILFLLLHNVFFHYGILNETYGNWTGGVTHPYTLKGAVTRLWLMVTSMSGYDEFMAGAFWFFRGLLVASILYLVLHRLVERAAGGRWAVAAAVICVAMVALLWARVEWGIRQSPIPNGGWREMWGVFFFGVGVLYRQYQDRIRWRGVVSVVCLAFICYAATQHFSGMNNGCRMRDLWSLPLTGTAGFVMLHTLSRWLDGWSGRLRDGLVFLGDNTLYVFVFHIIAFKAVSLAKIWWYDLPFEQIGCHMVIHDMRPDLFWIPYSIAGVALPLLFLLAYRRLRTATPRLMASLIRD